MNLLGRIAWLFGWLFSFAGYLWFLGAAFVSEWFLTRRYLRLLAGLPAIVVPIGLAIVLGQTQRKEHQGLLLERYRARANQALQADDVTSAELYLGRISTFSDRQDPWIQHALAQVAELRGDDTRARHLLQEIAPADQAGYGPAHFWLAKDLLRRVQPLDAASFKQVLHHLQQTLEDDPGHAECHALLAQLYLAVRQPASAVPHLEAAVDAYPQLRLPLARLYLAEGKQQQAEAAAREASELFAAAAESQTGGNARLLWAEAETLLGNYPRAAEILKQAGASQHDGHRTALARLYLVWTDALRREGKGFDEQLQKLRQVLELIPNHAGALHRVVAISASDDPAAETAGRWISQALADGDVPASVRFLLGTKAAERGDLADAVEHLEQAYEQGLTAPELLNNLAWALSELDPTQLERALQLISQAVEQAPRNAEIRETRGQIYIQLGRYENAITDLELALPALGRRPKIHAALAIAYEQLGDESMAAQHRKLARQPAQVDEP